MLPYIRLCLQSTLQRPYSQLSMFYRLGYEGSAHQNDKDTFLYLTLALSDHADSCETPVNNNNEGIQKTDRQWDMR